MKKLLLLFPICFLAYCSQKQIEGTIIPPSEYDRPIMAIDSESPLYKEALRFDLFLKNQLPDEDSKLLQSQCKKKKIDSPFCYSVNHSKELFSLHEIKSVPKTAPVPKLVTPLSPTYRNGKISNWRALRRGEIAELLKGFLALSKVDLITLGEMSKAEKKCPNRIAIAVAATLEDYMPEEIDPQFLASLYEKGGLCKSESRQDRENFLTRAALFYVYGQNWKKAVELLSRITPNDAFSGRTLFWLATAQKNMNDLKGYRKTLKRLLNGHPFSFHAVIASHREKEPLFNEFKSEPILPTTSKKSVGFNSIIRQVEILNRNQFFLSADLLVDWALGKFTRVEPKAILYLASMGDARAKTQYASNLLYFKNAFRTQEALKLAYSKPYESIFLKGHRTLPVHFIFSIARKESVFYPLAVSNADARGLLQLTPDLVDKMGIKNANLFEPRINLEIGAKHLESLSELLEGKLYYIAAAYNAGIQPVHTWKKRYRHPDVLLTLDLFPYRETRDYVGAVLTNYYWYNRIYGDGETTFNDFP